MQFSTLVPLCVCPATELVTGVPLPAPSTSSRKIVFHCIIIIVIISIIIIIIIIFIIIIINIIIIVRRQFGSSPLDRCGKRRGPSVCRTALICLLRGTGGIPVAVC